MSRTRHKSDSVREQLRRQVYEQILSLPVPAFEHLIARLLRACGYEGVQVLAHTQSGADLSAVSPCGLSKVTTLVQAKQYRTPVSRRFVDELRGAMSRTGAPQGVLLTTSDFYLPAYRAVWQDCPLPVRLVDGGELIDLLIAHGLGVQTSAKEHIGIDRAFFKRLKDEHGNGPRPQQRPHVTPRPDSQTFSQAALCKSELRSQSQPHFQTKLHSWLDIFRGD